MGFWRLDESLGRSQFFFLLSNLLDLISLTPTLSQRERELALRLIGVLRLTENS